MSTELGDSVGDRTLEAAMVAGSLSNSKGNKPMGSVSPRRLAPHP
jgi:hypothetical protein